MGCLLPTSEGMARSTSHDLPLACHVRMPTIRPCQPTRHPIVPGDECLPPIPHQKTGPVHRRVGKAPERIGLIGQKIRREERVVFRPNRLAADRAMRATG
jgi:hypothetical protein